MNISLTPELDTFVQDKVKSGLYHSASEVIREGLRLLKEQEVPQELRVEELRKQVREGFVQIEKGEFLDSPPSNRLSPYHSGRTQARRAEEELVNEKRYRGSA